MTTIEMCKHYTTTGYPKFKPKCEKGYFSASLKCHSKRKDCPDYEPSESRFGEKNEISQ